MPLFSRLACALLMCAWIMAAEGLRAHEVDQFDIPLGQELVDQGEYWDNLLHGAVVRAVEKTNRSIDNMRQVLPGLREIHLSRLRSPTALTKAVRDQLPGSMMAIEGLEWKLHHGSPKPEDPHLAHAHFSSRINGTYGALPYWPDPRVFNRMSLLRCSTIKVHGHYIGTDKVSHFVGMGIIYHTYYRYARLSGATREEAIGMALKMGRYGPISENWLVGGIPTGIYSSADMAANYAGLKYYLNITEPITLCGQTQPPLVVFDGQHWRLQPHATPEYFAQFVSRHWDEVLNPCLYEWTFRSSIRRRVQSHREAILARYAGDDPARHTPEYFDAVLADCLTYYGEEYGHSGQLDKLITVSRTCFDQPTTDDPALRAAGLAAAMRPMATEQPLQTPPREQIAAHCERLPTTAVWQACHVERLPPCGPPTPPKAVAPVYQALREARSMR
ncbi:MAG: hypothetical protein AB7O62_20375 [Pirellulales bacterium]